MRRPLSILDVILGWSWMRRPWLRRAILALACVVLALLAIFPRVYVAEMKLAPQDSDTASLRSLIAQMGGNYAALLGQHEAVEIDLAIGRSFEVQSEVARRLGWVKGNSPAQFGDAVRKVQKHAEVRALRAGILEIEVTGHDAADVVNTVNVYSDVMRERLSRLSDEKADYKRTILEQRMAAARERLQNAQAAVERFRQNNGVITPDTQTDQAVANLSGLRARYQAIQVQLAKLRQFNTDDSFEVRSAQAELAGLQKQIAASESGIPNKAGLSASSLGSKSLQFAKLEQELKFAQSVYDSYMRYFEGSAIEKLTANFNMQVIEPANLDLGWHFNTIPAILFLLLAVIGVAAEFIFFRPPPGIPRVAE
ncbi:hypothetical protein CA233_06495 [Sphingomonas sp. ABOLD]|uniref:hypothetical protein n=1 Tax=Sphingomonas sp. ABOLD TaxID=1985877 RepID=UPI000F7E7DE1|nr:hypothetical protein [Sphingomonas sp. ABOLD]RSV50387.1 hypothetical protein CA233_06495 [Sphingomonas sp. ABOLD]